MTDLRQTRPPRNYLARREQWRLLALIVGLGAVLLVAYELHRGTSLTRGLQVFFGPRPAREGPIDTRLQALVEDDSPPDVIFMPREVQPPKDRSGEYFPGVRPGHLEQVLDDAFLRAQESDAWFHLLGILEKTDAKQLAEASSGRASFAQLFQQSNDYRGRLVTLEGTALRANPLTAPKNDYGIKEYWRIWLSPVDNPSSPIILYCLHLPEGFPTGMAIRQPIKATGFYFKRMAYEASDTLRTAPLVLVKTLDWTPPPPKPEQPGAEVPCWLLALIAAAVSALVVALVARKTRLGRPGAELPPPDFRRLAQSETNEELPQ